MGSIDLDDWACEPPAKTKRTIGRRPNLKGNVMMFYWGERLRGMQSLHSDSLKPRLVVNQFFSGGSDTSFHSP